ncbi:3-keto-5-aminohexanoate cleavage protein [Rhizobium sp. BT03]|nr:3-keto-5-aminohexanoate cleavage protein [Rhizobium sp. BT03]RVT69638.1 3-keto-5-aminohexanoate cleavage protein [Agrobacterium sp. CNPSo 2736]WHO77295.1 3-keto-5-aminohexanoate cleavage protein [Rhizobium sp. BT03]
MNNDVFITCAVTGAGDNFKKNPNVPIAPEAIARDVLAVADAGAAIAHIHVRDPETGVGSRRTDLYKAVIELVREKNNDIIINTTAGMGGDLTFGADDPYAFVAKESDLVSQKERLVHVEALRPDICTLDCGSYNVGSGNLVYISTSEQIRQGAEMIRAFGVKPELEVFDLGHMQLAMDLLEKGYFDGSAMVQFCLGVNYGAPATTTSMKAFVDMAQGKDVVWSAFGVGRMQLPMVAQAVILGGNVRVGLEDNIWLKKGELATNVALVDRAKTIIEAMGAKVMSSSAARDRLGLKAGA